MDWEEFKHKRLSDVGTRYLFYSELISVWEEQVELIRRQSYVGKADQARQETITASIELLRNTLDGIAEYHDQQIALRRLIDYIPGDPALVSGGRGTPLTKPLIPGKIETYGYTEHEGMG